MTVERGIHEGSAGSSRTVDLFTKIDDHITYLMVRIDPDKAVPLKDEAASKAYLRSDPKAGARDK